MIHVISRKLLETLNRHTKIFIDNRILYFKYYIINFQFLLLSQKTATIQADNPIGFDSLLF